MTTMPCDAATVRGLYAQSSTVDDDGALVRKMAEAVSPCACDRGVTADMSTTTTTTTTKTSCAPSRFTVTYTNRPLATNAMAAAAAATATTHGVVLGGDARADMAAQRASVRSERAAAQRRWTDACKAAARMRAADARIAVKALLRCAAQRDLALARQAKYAPVVISFMRQAWRTYVQEADAVLDACANVARVRDCAASPDTACRDDGDDDRDDDGDNSENNSNEDDDDDGSGSLGNAVSVAALENVSSAGVWYSGPSMSLPLRRYAIQTLAADGVVHDAVLVGYAHFTYSSYVMQLRSACQAATLAELHRMSEQLHTSCLFLPRLIVAPTAAPFVSLASSS